VAADWHIQMASGDHKLRTLNISQLDKLCSDLGVSEVDRDKAMDEDDSKAAYTALINKAYDTKPRSAPAGPQGQPLRERQGEKAHNVEKQERQQRENAAQAMIGSNEDVVAQTRLRGALLMQTGNNWWPTWEEKHCVITYHRLKWWATSEDAKGGKPPEGELSLKKVALTELPGGKFTLQDQSGQKCCLDAGAKFGEVHSKSEWVTALEHATGPMRRPNSTFPLTGKCSKQRSAPRLVRRLLSLVILLCCLLLPALMDCTWTVSPDARCSDELKSVEVLDLSQEQCKARCMEKQECRTFSVGKTWRGKQQCLFYTKCEIEHQADSTVHWKPYYRMATEFIFTWPPVEAGWKRVSPHFKSAWERISQRISQVWKSESDEPK